MSLAARLLCTGMLFGLPAFMIATYPADKSKARDRFALSLAAVAFVLIAAAIWTANP